MAAYAALVSLMNIINDLEHHPSPPFSLDRQQVDPITKHITIFQEFLESYNPPPSAYEEEAADLLELRIADAAYGAEDAIETHIVERIQQQSNFDNGSIITRLMKYFGVPNPIYERLKSVLCRDSLQRVIEEMESIEKVVIVKVDAEKKMALKNVPAPVACNSTMVGSDGALLEILEMLIGGRPDRRVIPIVGMGGIGKTFLAKTIYAKPLIKDRFYISAWATISQNYDTREILCEVLCQATKRNKESMSGKSVDQLGLDLYKYLFPRRFLIVMDDMWSIDSWDEIQHYFPDKSNGSRVLVTTRLSQLSFQLNNDYSLRMSFLDKASSWDLFSKTVFGEKSSCPPELEEIGEKIVDNCRGLPLSIVVVGGILKKVDATPSSWESIRDNFTSEVNMDNDKHCLRLLKQSYNHLPVYLKPCFLYMGVFEEDKEIRVATLLQLWVSEGFLKPTNGEALETTARRFLQDLIDINLILIGKLGSTGSLKFCKMHDLVRDMCMKEGQKEGFYHVIGQSSLSHPQGMNTQRRVVIPKYTSKENLSRDLEFMLDTRSIIGEHGELGPLSFWNLVLLRTLDERKCMESGLSHYVNLRHIAINMRENGPPKMIWSFFPSISRLWNLHTLIVAFNILSEPALFADFWKRPQFRHMEIVDGYVCLPDPPSCDGRGGDAVVVMENLHTLKGVSNFKCGESVVKRIPNIKRLKLEYKDYIDGDDDVYLLGNIKYLCGLEFLSVKFSYVRRPIALTQHITFPHSLKKLSIWMFIYFEWDDILEKIGTLPLLDNLKLLGGRFGKGKWEIGQEQFPCLKHLELDSCRGLKNWTASEEDSSILPRLERLVFEELEELKEIPFEIGNIDTLKSIKLDICEEELVKSVKKMFDEQVELQGGEDQLSFHVEVHLTEDQEHLMSLASPNFYVNSYI